jgi:threonine dehydrogenase-like Zn-dependent dehydrogenase
MKRAMLFGDGSAGLVDAADPKPKGDWALVKVHAAPLCTEYKYTHGDPMPYIGHEAAGEVVAIDKTGSVSPGQRVVVMPMNACGSCALCGAGDYIYCEHNADFAAIHGSMEGSATLAQYLLKPSWLLMPVPDDMSYEKAALACCGLGPSFGAFRRMNLRAGETVLITGAGPVGLGATVNALFIGARVIVVESAPFRAERARRMGAAHVLDPHDPNLLSHIRDITGGIGVDAALDCSGTPAGERACIDATRRRGRVAFIGECWQPVSLWVSNDLIRKGLTVIGSWHYNKQDFPEVLRVIQESPVIDLLISHVMPMHDIQHALDLCASAQTAKVILQPWANGKAQM